MLRRRLASSLIPPCSNEPPSLRLILRLAIAFIPKDKREPTTLRYPSSASRLTTWTPMYQRPTSLEGCIPSLIVRPTKRNHVCPWFFWATTTAETAWLLTCYSSSEAGYIGAGVHETSVEIWSNTSIYIYCLTQIQGSQELCKIYFHNIYIVS